MQKSAYEIRISDWSSDVCSSDLMACRTWANGSTSERRDVSRRPKRRWAGLIHVPINPLLKSHQAAHILEDSDAALLVTLHDRATSLGEADWRGTALTLEEHWDGLCAEDTKIGRASCRERGCKYG